MTKFYVYELVVVPDGNVCYVGKGSGKRMFKHRANLKMTRYTSAGLYRRLRDLLSSGRDFQPRKVFETDDEQLALAEEKRRIELYGFENLFNSTTLQGLAVADIGEAHRQALSKARREYVAKLEAETGHKMPPEVAAKIANANKGRAKTKEAIAKQKLSWKADPANISKMRQQALKMCLAHTGKKRSAAYCAKLSAIRKGKSMPPGHGAKTAEARRKSDVRSTEFKSVYRGVSWLQPKKAWQSRLCYNGKVKLLGQFKLELDAAWTYDNAFELLFSRRPNRTPKDHVITRFQRGKHGLLIPIA